MNSKFVRVSTVHSSFIWNRSTSDTLLAMARDAMSYLPVTVQRAFIELDSMVEEIILVRTNQLHKPEIYKFAEIEMKDLSAACEVVPPSRGFDSPRRHPLEYQQHILAIYKSILDYEFTRFESSYKNALAGMHLVLFMFRGEEEEEEKLPHVDFKRRWAQLSLIAVSPSPG
jgi:hypothetical protein